MSTKPDPVDEYWAARDKIAAERNPTDLAAWQGWKAAPTPQTLSPLLGRFDDVFGKAMQRFRAPNVNTEAMRAHMTRQALKAFETFDPSRGAQLRSYVHTHVNRAHRFNKNNQNMALIPEEKSNLIGPIDSATDQLSDQLGRPPTLDEVAMHLGVKPALVKEVQGLRRADISGSVFESDPTTIAGSTHEQVVRLLPTAITDPSERAVFDYMFGQNGKPRVESTGEIAKRMGKSPSQISVLRGKIEKKYRQGV